MSEKEKHAVEGKSEPRPKQPQRRPDPTRLRAAQVAAKKKTGGGGKPKFDGAPADPGLFGLDQAGREGLLKTLEGGRGQRKLGMQIEEEAIRVYKAARLRATGNGFVKLGDQGRRAARDIGVACIGYGISPEALIEYWQDPANNFTDMKFPSLAFLANEKNLDRAAAVVVPAKGSRKNRAAGRGHSFDDVGELDTRIRAALAGAGIDVSEATDRKLMTVQNAAKALAAGRTLSMGKDLRKMATKVKHLFKGG